jgi:hypothetical protein
MPVDHLLFLLSVPATPTEVIFEFLPVELPSDAGGEAVHLAPLWIRSPVDGWMYGFAVMMTDVDGESVPSGLLHHLKVLKPGERELFHPTMLRVMAAGAETRDTRIPRSIGVPVKKGDSLLATAMLHDEHRHGYRGVRLRVRIDVMPAGDSPSPKTAYPFFLQVPGPEEISEFDLPPGRSETSFEARPAVAGRVVGFGGHAHRYAVELRFEDVTRGRILWRSRIRTDTAGTVVDVPRTTYTLRRGPILDPDHVYRVTVVYDNPTGETLYRAGMGTVGGLIVPQGEWPRVDRDHPLYVFDRARELNGSGGGARLQHVH